VIVSSYKLKGERMIHRFILTILILGASLLAPSESGAQAETVFSGVPEVKVSVVAIDLPVLAGGRAIAGVIPPKAVVIGRDRAVDLACVISRIEDRYYWASRENKELVRIVSGGFVTFLAVDGAGYVRIIVPEMKEAVSLMSGTEKRFDYVEHLLLGLRSVTYYGVAEYFWGLKTFLKKGNPGAAERIDAATTVEELSKSFPNGVEAYAGKNRPAPALQEVREVDY